MTRRRTPEEVGACIRQRRAELGLTQDAIPGISAAALRKLEAGTAPTPRDAKRIALLRGLQWKSTALDDLTRGADPATLVEVPITVDASGVNMDELRRADPEAYDAIEQMARIALDRARKRSNN